MARRRKGITVKGGPVGALKTSERAIQRRWKSPRKRGKRK